MAASLTNHILQSTIFAAVAGILTLFLRNNHARTRYWIWLTASMKFLVPFSLFVEIGHRLSWSTAPVIALQPRLAIVIDEISQPYLDTATPMTAATNTPSILPALLPALWMSGCVAVLIFWLLRWLRVAAILRTSQPIGEGRELRALRRLDPTVGLLISPTQIEPGVFGILRPVLSLPAGISNHLDDAQLDAIFAHEVCHIRSRDNLTAALHMLVEAIFWFHPLVWWIGARLVEERERACDEAVVRMGSDPEIYAETILKICKIYLASPLTCAAGISGSNLGKRIESIMKNPIATNLSDGRRLLLGTLSLLAFVMPVAFGILSAPPIRAGAQTMNAQSTRLEFEAANIAPVIPGPIGRSGGPGTDHPDEVTYQSTSLSGLIKYAFGINEDQLSGPASLYLDNYSITAKVPPGTSQEQLRVMWQNLLADRFHLTVHHATRETPGYELLVAASGPKLKDSALAPHASERSGARREVSLPALDKDGFPQLGNWKGMSVIATPGGGSKATYQSSSISALVRLAARQLGAWTPAGSDAPIFVPALVVDKTGLTGEYDFTLAYAGKEGGNTDFPDVFEKQLGLKLQKVDRIPVDLVIVDHVDTFPAGN